MPRETAVASHYTLGNLLAAIEAGVAKLGKTPATVTVEDLAPVDEFHMGGRPASEHFLDRFAITQTMHVLDVGCGLGGAARFVADRYGARVSGIDLTPEFVATGQALNDWVGLGDRITLEQGSALGMPFEDETFDAAYTMHVGMNIADKRALFAEAARVLKPGAVFGVYDVMRIGEGPLAYPVPWASSSDDCALAEPDAYRAALSANGLSLEEEVERRDFAVAFFAAMMARVAEHGPPPLGLHVLLGETRADKLESMVDALNASRIAPVEMIARKAA
jgi:SAM-dependent methyltransferase